MQEQEVALNQDMQPRLALAEAPQVKQGGQAAYWLDKCGHARPAPQAPAAGKLMRGSTQSWQYEEAGLLLTLLRHCVFVLDLVTLEQIHQPCKLRPLRFDASHTLSQRVNQQSAL